MTDQLKIPLNSFVRRTDDTNRLKAIILETGAALTRTGRSRNWQLSLTTMQAIALRRAIESANQNSWLWIANAIQDHSPILDTKALEGLAKQHWPLSVSALVALTDCTNAQARRVIDKIEWAEGLGLRVEAIVTFGKCVSLLSDTGSKLS